MRHLKKENAMYILITRDGDEWEYENLENARRDQYIFGGAIKKIK